MAKYSRSVFKMPSINPSRCTGDGSASQWSALSVVGDQMAHLGYKILQLGQKHSQPKRQDLAEMMELCSRMMHISSLFLEDSSAGGTYISTVPYNSKKKTQDQSAHKRTRMDDVPVPGITSSSQSTTSSNATISSTAAPKAAPSPNANQPDEERANKRTRLYDTPVPAIATSSQSSQPSNAILSSTASPEVAPFSSLNHPDEQHAKSFHLFPPLLDGIDPTITGFFSESFGTIQGDNAGNVDNASTAVAFTAGSSCCLQGGPDEQIDSLYNEFVAAGGPIVTDTSRNKEQVRKRGKAKEANYLKKLVAHTIPRVALKTYLQQHNRDLVCLCGRGAHNNHHKGNQIYLDLIQKRLLEYKSRDKKGREEFTNSLVQEFEDAGRHFLKENENGQWEVMERKSVRAKVSQNFRDAKTTN
eukprot:CAMPEP_0183719074 /NCGR_PEP_ID=MMETSP0737-20130205/12150_1 /TAXON_ID=385413 /ORGANISM="Thalassiosira miniscula, Strain CCMP1093" /LENGTH=414 /DNA_ID=CAMNT_0025948759 /DNA_START=350 /DNA_END=1594 /DNA_ORIENTATION=-